MPLVRFYLDYFDGFGKLRDIYFAYRCQKAKIMPSFDKIEVAQIAPIFSEAIILISCYKDIKTLQGCYNRLLAVVYAEAADLASSFSFYGPISSYLGRFMTF